VLTLDPLKLALVAVVALVVLGPDKVPAMARRVGSLLADLERLRSSLREEVDEAVGGLPLGDGLRGAEQALESVRGLRDPHAARQALYRAAGLEPAAPGTAITSTEQPAPAGSFEDADVPGALDLGRSAPHLLRPVAPDHLERALEAPDASGEAWQPALFDVVQVP